MICFPATTVSDCAGVVNVGDVIGTIGIDDEDEDEDDEEEEDTGGIAPPPLMFSVAIIASNTGG